MGHMGHVAPSAHGVYKPRRPQASPLFRLVQDDLHRLLQVPGGVSTRRTACTGAAANRRSVNGSCGTLPV